jgi:hypothetical protein
VGCGGSRRTHASATFLAALVAALGASSAPAAPAGADLRVEIGVSKELTQNFPGVPNGGTRTIEGLDFSAGFQVSLINLEPGGAKLRFQLSEGLRFGTDAPDAEEMCANLGSAAECTVPTREPILMQSTWGIGWDVVAERPGTYLLRAEIVETTTPPDPNPSDNSASATVVVTEAAGGGGGGGVSVSASAVKLTPTKPKAGSVVAASVRVTAGGAPVRPARIACAGRIGNAKLDGSPRAARGTATCVYRTPRSATGRTLRGTVSFTARGQRFARRFSARIG